MRWRLYRQAFGARPLPALNVRVTRRARAHAGRRLPAARDSAPPKAHAGSRPRGLTAAPPCRRWPQRARRPTRTVRARDDGDMRGSAAGRRRCSIRLPKVAVFTAVKRLTPQTPHLLRTSFAQLPFGISPCQEKPGHRRAFCTLSQAFRACSRSRPHGFTTVIFVILDCLLMHVLRKGLFSCHESAGMRYHGTSRTRDLTRNETPLSKLQGHGGMIRMNLPGLITVAPDQTTLIDELANMMGESFLEELWTAELLSAAVDGPDAESVEARRLESVPCHHARGLHAGQRRASAATPPEDRAGLRRRLPEERPGRGQGVGRHRDRGHAEAWRTACSRCNETMQPARADGSAWRPSRCSTGRKTEAKADGRAPTSSISTRWASTARRRGSGAFRRLMTPFFDYADEHGIPCFLETYSEAAWKGCTRTSASRPSANTATPGFAITERCMVRRPR